MQERPDSALAIIRQLDTNTIRTPRYKAKYALTKAIALDKNYIDTTDAGFLANAGRYYAKRGSKEDKMTYKYYLGRVQYNAGDFQNAAVSYMEALKYADDVENAKLKGMIYGALGDTYSKSHNNKDQLRYELLAFDTFEKYGDPSYLNYVRYKLATAYHNNREFDKSDSLLSTICDNDYLVKEATLVMADNEIHREPHNPARIVQLFESAIAAKAHMDFYRYYQYAYALSESGRYDEANRLLSLLSKYPDNVKTYWWKYRINKIKRDTSDALKALETYCELSDSVVVAKLEQSVYKAQADHYALVSEIEKTKAQVSRLFVIITLLVSVIVLSALVIVFKGRKNRLIAEKEQLILQQEESNKMLDLIREREKREGKMAKLQISNLSMMNEDYKSKLNALREDFAKLYRKQFVDIQSLYAVNNNLETLSDRAIKKSAEKYSEIIAYLTNPEKQNALEDRLNSDLDGIMSKLRSDFKSFSEEQFRFLSYIILGFDASSLAFLFDTTKNNVWVRKHRLKERIFNSDTKNKDLYQAFIQ